MDCGLLEGQGQSEEKALRRGKESKTGSKVLLLAAGDHRANSA